MIKNQNLVTAVFILVAGLLLAGCAQSTPVPSPTPLPPTSTPEPTETATAIPTDTPIPSPTPIPPTATPEPTETAIVIPIAVEDILGLWFASEHDIPHYNQFGDDGMIRAYGSLTDIENGDHFALDQYALEGDIITLEGIGGVCRRISGQYRVSMPEPGKVQFKLVSDTCTNRINGLNNTVYIAVPTEAAAAIPFTVEDLFGIWESTNHDLLHYNQFTEDGALRAAESLAKMKNGLFLARDEYVLEGDIITITGGPGLCKGLSGQYQITFFETEEIQFEVIQDTCENRIAGINGTIYSLVQE